MSSINNPSSTNEQPLPELVHFVFSQLKPQDVEQFSTAYKRWILQQHILALQTHISALKQQIDTNSKHMQDICPSAIALAALARLQASDVSDIDLLDRMLERGEAWLDHTIQLLERCESLDIIHDDYTHWCELALEGAYDWIDSMQETSASSPTIAHSEPLDGAIEVQLLQKLQREDETEKVPFVTVVNTEIHSQAEIQVEEESPQHNHVEVIQAVRPRKQRGLMGRLLVSILHRSA